MKKLLLLVMAALTITSCEKETIVEVENFDRINELQREVAALEEAINTLTTQNTTFQDALADYAVEVSNLEAQLATASEAEEVAEADIIRLENEVSNLEVELNKYLNFYYSVRFEDMFPIKISELKDESQIDLLNTLDALFKSYTKELNELTENWDYTVTFATKLSDELDRIEVIAAGSSNSEFHTPNVQSVEFVLYKGSDVDSIGKIFFSDYEERWQAYKVIHETYGETIDLLYPNGY